MGLRDTIKKPFKWWHEFLQRHKSFRVIWWFVKAAAILFLFIVLLGLLMMSWEWVALIFFLIIDPTTTLNEITGETLGILPVILMFIVFIIIRELWASLRSGLSADRQRKEKEKEQRLDFSGNEVKVRVEKDRTNEGRRVELIYTSNPRTSLNPGDRGKYEWVYKYPSSLGNQHFIRWDNGSGMILIDGKDSFKFVDEEKLDEEKGEE